MNKDVEEFVKQRDLRRTLAEGEGAVSHEPVTPRLPLAPANGVAYHPYESLEVQVRGT